MKQRIKFTNTVWASSPNPHILSTYLREMILLVLLKTSKELGLHPEKDNIFYITGIHPQRMKKTFRRH